MSPFVCGVGVPNVRTRRAWQVTMLCSEYAIEETFVCRNVPTAPFYPLPPRHHTPTLGCLCRGMHPALQESVDNRNSKAEQCSGVPKGQPYQSPGRRQGELCEPWRSPGLRTLSARSPNGTALRSNAFSSDSRARLRFCLGPPRCGCRRLGICTQGGVNVRCARVSLPWALLASSLRD